MISIHHAFTQNLLISTCVPTFISENTKKGSNERGGWFDFASGMNIKLKNYTIEFYVVDANNNIVSLEEM